MNFVVPVPLLLLPLPRYLPEPWQSSSVKVNVPDWSVTLAIPFIVILLTVTSMVIEGYLLVVTVLTSTSSPASGTVLPFQFAAVLQSVLVVPVHVRVAASAPAAKRKKTAAAAAPIALFLLRV